MMQYSAVLRQLCLVKSDETLFPGHAPHKAVSTKKLASRTQAPISSCVCGPCGTEHAFWWLLHKVLTESSLRFGDESLLQKVRLEGSMRFGGQSLLQKALTDRRQHAFWRPESSVRFGGQTLLQKALAEGAPRSLREVSARPVLPQRMLYRHP